MSPKTVGIVAVHGISDVVRGETAARVAWLLAPDTEIRHGRSSVSQVFSVGEAEVVDAAYMDTVSFTANLAESQVEVTVVDAGWSDLQPSPVGRVETVLAWLNVLSTLPDVGLREEFAQLNDRALIRLQDLARGAAAISLWWVVRGLGRPLAAGAAVILAYVLLGTLWSAVVGLVVALTVGMAATTVTSLVFKRALPFWALAALALASGGSGLAAWSACAWPAETAEVGQLDQVMLRCGWTLQVVLVGTMVALVFQAATALARYLQETRVGPGRARAICVFLGSLSLVALGYGELGLGADVLPQVDSASASISEVVNAASNLRAFAVARPLWRMIEEQMDLLWRVLFLALMACAVTGLLRRRGNATGMPAPATFEMACAFSVSAVWLVLHLGASGIFGVRAPAESVRCERPGQCEVRWEEPGTTFVVGAVGCKEIAPDTCNALTRLGVCGEGGFIEVRSLCPAGCAPEGRCAAVGADWRSTAAPGPSFKSPSVQRLRGAPFGDTDLVLFALIVGLYGLLSAAAAANVVGGELLDRFGVSSDAAPIATRLNSSLRWGPRIIAGATALALLSYESMKILADWGLDVAPIVVQDLGLAGIAAASGSIFIVTAIWRLADAAWGVDLLQDVLAFLTRPEIRGAAGARLAAAVRLLEAQGVERIVLLGHSQGTIVIADYIANLHFELEQRRVEGASGAAAPPELRVLTLGSPLRQRYALFLPALARRLVEVIDAPPAFVVRWINGWVSDDIVGRDIWGAEWASGAGPWPPAACVDRNLGMGGHTAYLDVQRGRRALSNGVRELLVELAYGHPPSVGPLPYSPTSDGPSARNA